MVCLCACIHIPTPLGGLSKIGSDPMKVVNEAMDKSTNVVSVMLKFAANLIAPEEDEGTVTLHMVEIQTMYPIKLKKSYFVSLLVLLDKINKYFDYSLSDEIMTLQCIYSFSSPLL